MKKNENGASFNLKNILVPVDFSGPSKKAVSYALSLARQFEAKITILYVLEPIPYPNDFLASYPLVADNSELLNAAGKELSELTATIKTDVPLTETLIRHGNPAHEICATARDLKADLIVISTHGYTGLKHVLLGSTAEKVVRHAPCPVLTIRQPA